MAAAQLHGKAPSWHLRVKALPWSLSLTYYAPAMTAGLVMRFCLFVRNGTMKLRRADLRAANIMKNHYKRVYKNNTGGFCLQD